MKRTSKTTSQCLIEEVKNVPVVLIHGEEGARNDTDKITEPKCVPCSPKMHHAKAEGVYEGMDKEELCTICYTQELGAEHCT